MPSRAPAGVGVNAAKQAREFQPPEAIKDRAGSGCAGANFSA